MSEPMRPSDPAYWMLEQGISDPTKRSTKTVHSDGCYICCDPEFALMGLPLCTPCVNCSGHVAADDCVCDACGHDQQAEATEREVRSQRGRWLAVDDSGFAIRCARKSQARNIVQRGWDLGIPGRVIRYRSERVQYANGCLAVVGRWCP